MSEPRGSGDHTARSGFSSHQGVSSDLLVAGEWEPLQTHQRPCQKRTVQGLSPALQRTGQRRATPDVLTSWPSGHSQRLAVWLCGVSGSASLYLRVHLTDTGGGRCSEGCFSRFTVFSVAAVVCRPAERGCGLEASFSFTGRVCPVLEAVVSSLWLNRVLLLLLLQKELNGWTQRM